jgi:hypothetical protein
MTTPSPPIAITHWWPLVLGAAGGRTYRAVIICWNGQLGPRPLGKDIEETGDVFDDLAGVLWAEVTPQARLPQGDGLVDQVVVRCA